MVGFGMDPFGVTPFGDVDWAKVVLWDELPEEKRREDEEAGGWYKKFATAMMPSFNQLRFLIYKSHEHTLSPRKARKDLLRYIAAQFGIIPDLDEPEAYQRTKIEIAGRWRLIKGTNEAYKVLCAIHGFRVVVQELWWDGVKYTTDTPTISGEVIAVVP